MVLNKYIYSDGDYFHYYFDNKYKDIRHGLKRYSRLDIGYRYHDVEKGFWLRNKNRL